MQLSMTKLMDLKPARTRGFAAQFGVILGFAALLVGPAFGTIITPDRVVPWVPGVTVGVQMQIPTRTNLLDVTRPPYNADRTGTSDASAAIQSAINAAGINDVVYLPTGKYRLSSSLFLDKSYVSLRGDGPNKTVLLGLTASSVVLKIGHDAISYDTNRTHAVLSGTSKGSTNFVLSSIHNAYGDTLAAGALCQISTTTRNAGRDTLPIISVANFNRIIRQDVVIQSIIGSTVNLTAPLVWDFTNAPMLQEQSTFIPPRQSIGVESLGITLTNNGEAGSAIFMLYGSCIHDCWFTNLDIGFANNYQLYLSETVSCSVQGCKIHDALTYGTSHSGLLIDACSGLLVENNIISDGLFPGIEFNGGTMGCVFFANFFTNNAGSDIDCHNTHPMMNLWEGNVLSGGFEMDGYFGSASHQTLLRNRIPTTTSFKRWTSQMSAVGNVMGSTNYSYVYYREESGYGSPYGIFEFGFPNIGNNSYTGSNLQIAWNFPGRSVLPFTSPFTPIANGVFTFTNNQGPTNVLWGNFTNIPAPIASCYPLIFQDSSNTNVYYGDLGGAVVVSTAAGTSSNLTLNTSITVSNGWTLYLAGQNAYQQLQSSDKFTHVLHGNLVYTNSTGAVVWDSGIADHSIPASLLYTNGAPAWWGTNAWPAIGPDRNPVSGMIPAQERFLSLPIGKHSKLPPPDGLRFAPR